MRRLRASIREHDVFWWVDDFLGAAFTRDLADFPQPDGSRPEDYQDFPMPF